MGKNKTSMVIACPKCGKPVATLNRTRETESVFRAAEQHHCDCESENSGSAKPAAVVVTIETPSVETKADKRLAALRKAGVDTSKYTALNGVLIRISTSGAPEIVADNDPVFNGILVDGTIPARELFMRWIPAQMLAALDYESYNRHEFGFTPWLKAKGYEYSLKVTLHWLQFISQCRKHGDTYNADIVSARFDADTAIDILQYDYSAIKDYISNLPVKNCKGREYKRVKGFGKGVFVDEIDAKVLKPLRSAIVKFSKAKTESARVNAFSAYLDVRKVKLDWRTAMSRRFVDAFKAVGAFYTMRDMILFEGCRIHDTSYDKHHNTILVPISKEKSLARIEEAVKRPTLDGYCILGELKEFLERNHVDVTKQREEWHQRSINRRALK